MASVAANLESVRARIAAAGGDLERITLVAVTKGWPIGVVEAAVAAGVVDLGENYAQQLVEKATQAPPGVRWHFLGPVQRNKITALRDRVHLWHGLDRSVAADAIAARAPGAGVLVQVNVTDDPGQHGCSVGDTPALVEHAQAVGLTVRGLMAIGPQGPPEATRPIFRRVAALGRDLGVAELSMGMSADFEVAVQEGATIVRIGTALFGPRSVHAEVRR